MTSSWSPLPLAEAVELFGQAGFRWWVSGGHALELHLGRSWRSHDDTDIGIVRSDATSVRTVLGDWDVHIAAAGTLTPWDGLPLSAERSENNLWCRRAPGAPWRLDVTIGEGEDGAWVYRRDATIRRPWHAAVLESSDGVPYLAPELQLLFKSRHRRRKDDLDAATVLPELTADRRTWLSRQLPETHPWQQLVELQPRRPRN